MATNKTPAPARVAPTDDDETLLYAKSLRRCAFCFGLDNDHGRKRGQIAHVDQNRANSKFANLAWLCLPHHDEYDGKTSQSKNLTRKELEYFRDKLYQYNTSLPAPTRILLEAEVQQIASLAANPLAPAEVNGVREFLRQHQGFFEYLFYEREYLAKAIRSDAHDVLENLLKTWGNWQSFDRRVRDVQERLRAVIGAIYNVFDIQWYDLEENGYIMLAKNRAPRGTFESKQDTLKPLIVILHSIYQELDEFAIS